MKIYVLPHLPLGWKITLSIIFGTICLVAAIIMINNQAASSNLDAVTSDLINLASRSQQHFRRPTAMGGGGGSFTLLTTDYAGLAYITTQPTSENGTYSISTPGTTETVIIQGVGTKDGDGDGTPCTAQVQVWEDSLSVTVTNR